jgi:hypothetical protein
VLCYKNPPLIPTFSLQGRRRKQEKPSGYFDETSQVFVPNSENYPLFFKLGYSFQGVEIASILLNFTCLYFYREKNANAPKNPDESFFGFLFIPWPGRPGFIQYR